MAQGEQGEQQQQDSAVATTKIIIPREQLEEENQKLAKKTFTIKGWEAYYNVPGKEWDLEDDSNDNGVTEPYWSIHYNTLEGKMIRRRDGRYLFVPTDLEVQVDKHKYDYGDKPKNQMVAALTSGVRFHTQEIPKDYDIKSDTFVASKIDFSQYPHQILGDPKIKNLYDIAVKENLIPQPSELFHEIQIDKLQSYTLHGYKGNNDSMLFYKAFLAKEVMPLHSGLMPSEEQREYSRLLREFGAKIEEMKKKDQMQAALLQRKWEREEEAYQKEMAEISARVRKGTSEEMSQGAICNAETVFEEQGQGGEEEEKT
jgi:hypothetical protein